MFRNGRDSLVRVLANGHVPAPTCRWASCYSPHLASTLDCSPWYFRTNTCLWICMCECMDCLAFLFFLIWEGGGLSKLRDWVWNLAHCVDLRAQCSGASWGSPGALPGILKPEEWWAVHNSNSRLPHKAIFLDILALILAPPDTRKWKECIHVFGEIVWVKKAFWKYKGKDSW